MASAHPEKKPKSSYRLKKNAPVHSHGINEIYLDRAQPFNQQLERTWRILNEGKLDHVVVHGIGPVIQRAINLALQIQIRGGGMFDVSVTTHTVYLHDDLSPVNPDKDVVTSQTRKNSSVSVKIFRTLDMGSCVSVG